MFQHTAARRRLITSFSHAVQCVVSTHSRPKAAAVVIILSTPALYVSTHSRPKAAVKRAACTSGGQKFQHTAARRRLLAYLLQIQDDTSFNTQPPEGGWV